MKKTFLPTTQRGDRLFGALLLLAVAALLGGFALHHERGAAHAPTEPATPRFSASGGYYERNLRLELSAPEGDVLFTTDGSVPTRENATRYARPLLLDAASGVTVVRARVALPNASLGPVTTASYFVGIDASLPLISLVVDPPSFWSTEDGLHFHPLARGRDWERPVEVTFVDEDRRSGFHLPAGVRIHGYQSRAAVKKSFRLYFRGEYGATRLNYPLFPESQMTSFNRLVLHNGGQDWPMPPLLQWTLMRNTLAERLAREVGGVAPHSRPALLFVNGEPWGIYLMRERLDEDYFADHFGLKDVDYLDSPNSYLRETHLGDRQHWDALIAYLESHDLSDPAAYAYVAAQVDLGNLIDYFLIQMYSGNTDWPYHNVLQFRSRNPGGRWQWVFWDTDNGFAADGYSNVETDLVDYVLHTRNVETEGRDTLLLRGLLANEGFRQRFLLRAAELLNTTLSPEGVIAHIDALAMELAPDLHYEAARWPAPGVWEEHVEALRSFARERSAVMREQFVAGFGLGGTFTLEVAPPVEGEGTLAVGGRPLEALSWSGIYFTGVPLQVTAVPAPSYRFAGWNLPEVAAAPMITVTGPLPAPLAPRFERVAAGEPAAGDVVISAVQVDADEGDWVELRVARGSVDLRGWRVTDNDTLAGRDEGSLILPALPELARVRWGTRVRLVASRGAMDGTRLPADDLNAADGLLVLYAGNGALDIETDPWFDLAPGDNVALLAPGASAAFADDVGIALVSDGPVTAASFGVLSDGVLSTPWHVEE